MHHCSSDKVIVWSCMEAELCVELEQERKMAVSLRWFANCCIDCPHLIAVLFIDFCWFFFVVRFMCMCNSTRYTCERLAAAAAAKTLNYINVVFLWLQWGLDLLLLPSIIAIQSFVISCVCVWDQLHNLLDKKIGKKNRFIPSIHHKMHLIIMRNRCKVQDALLVSIRQ